MEPVKYMILVKSIHQDLLAFLNSHPYKDGLMVAWTNIDGNQPSIKTVIIR